MKTVEQINHEVLITKEGRSYWNSTGSYQKEFDRLTESLVPDEGKADTKEGEIVRICNRLYYELCNNGNCNAQVPKEQWDEVDCSYCDGKGYYDEEETELCDYCNGSGTESVLIDVTYEVSEFYQEMLNDLLELLSEKLPRDIAYHLVSSVVCDICSCTEDPNYINSCIPNYNKLVDYSMYAVLNS